MKKVNYLSNLSLMCIGRWIKIVTLLLIGVLTTQHVNGQSAANYTYSTNATGSLALDMNGNATDMSTGTTSLIGPGNDDFSSSVVSIGFTFQLMGKQYTDFSVNSNGVVGLGGTVVGTGGTGLGNSTTPVIAAFGGDQATVTLASVNSKVHYKLFGTAPNRILVIEWANMKMSFTAFATATAGNGTYQVLMYETTGVVELKYGAMSVATTFSTGPAIGFSSGTTAGQIASITSSSNAVTTTGTAWINNTYTATAITNLNSSSDGSRRVYRITPKTAPNMTGSLTFTSVGAGSMTLNWTDVTGEIGYNIYRSTDGVNYTLVNTNAANTVTYAATGLTPTTTYYWQVVPITEGTVGTGLSASQATSAPATYYWVGATGGTWSTAANWNTLANNTGTTRATVSTTDILIVDGAGTTAGAATVINMDNAFTIGALRVTSNTTLTLQSSTTTARALTLSGGTNSFVIESGSTLNLNNAANAASIAFSGTGNTGDISGTLTFGGSTSNLVTTTGGTSTVVTVSSTGIVNLGVASTISLVGSTSTLVFANGSNCNASGSTTGAPSVPLATWGATSNLTITGITSSTVTATNNVQSFGNVTYNCASATGTMSFWTTSTPAVIKGNLNIVATGTGKFRALTNGTLTVNGNLNISGGTFETFSGAGTFIVLGNVNVSGGTMDIAAGQGTLRVAGNFIHTAGTVLQSTANGILEFNGTSAQTLTLVSGSHGTNAISMRINNATGVTTSSAISLRNLTVTSGNLTGSGSLTFATTSTLTYNSSTGSQTVSSIEFPTTNGPGSLAINNTSASPNNFVTLPFSVSLAGTTGTLALTAGILDNTGYVLTIPNTAVAAITGASATKYVKGAIARNLPASYSTASTYTFPVGKGSYNPFELVNPVTNAGGTVTIQAEVVDANSGGTIGSTLSAINTNRYWAASITAGSSNFTSSLIKLNDTPGSADAIASSSSLTGTYNRVGGGTATITSSAITSSAPAATTLSGFYLLANKSLATLSNLSISPTGNQCTNVSRAVTITVTPGGTAISGVALNYSLNGVAQSAIAMTNTSGDDWSGTIPTVSPANATVAWTVVATDASGLTQSQAGTGFKDAPITGFTPTASASPSTICSGSSTTLSSEIIGAGLVTLGSATTLTSATNQPTAFCNRWTGYRSQTVYTAAELVAAGLRAGNITSMAYNITSAGDALTNSGFVVKIGTTTLSTLSTTFESTTNFTTVYPSQTYTHTASGLQTITFSTPYNWDGVSNIIIDVIHNGANASNNSITYYTATTGNTVLTATSTGASTGTQSTQRLNLILNGTISLTPTSISWSDGLSTIGSGSSLVVSPTSATTYTSSVVYSGCSYTPSTTVNINALPSAPSVNNGEQCGTAIPTSATVTSTTGNSSPIFRWYSAATGGSALQSGTTNYYNTSISNTTTFYVSEFNGTCESVRSAVTATFVAPPAITVAVDKSIVCNNSVAVLSVTSTNSDFDSYVWSPATNLYQSDLTTPYTSGAVAYLKTTTAGSVNYTCSASNSLTSCINSASVTVTVQPASATVAASTIVAFCGTGSTTISVTPSTGFASGTLQWQSSLNGTSYSNINLATSTSISTGTLTQTTFYQLVVKDGAGATCLNPSTSVVVNNPSVASTTPASRCGTGAVTLGATLGGNANTLNWYSALSGGPVLGTGSTFTTPSISTTTTYYVAASTGSSTTNAGRLTPASTTNIAASSYGLVFDVTTAFTLNSVDVYNAGAAGTMSIQLQNSSGTVLQSLTTPTIPAGTGTTATTINLGWSIPVGTSYRLMAITSPSLVRESSIIGFPYAIGTVGSITSGYLAGTNTNYYYFYNWSVTTGCQSARTAVVATVNSSPTATASASSTTFCAGQSTNLSSVFYKPGSVAIGSGTGTHSASSSIGAAFGSYYGNGHAQVLILASELTAAGLGPGNLTGMSVNVISTGSPASLTNYTLKIGASSATAISSFQVSTFTTVFTSASYTPTVGTNTITFSTPYNWNGTSNILVDYCFANSVTGSSSAVNNITTTSFGSFVNYAADGATGSGACTNTTITNTSSNRPNLTLFGQQATALTNYTWSNGTSTVGSDASITVTPTGSTTYTVTATDVGGCTVSASTSVVVNALPSSPSVTNGTQCGAAIPTTTTVTSTSGSSSPIFRWYAAATGGSALQSGTINYYNTSISNTTTFYVSEFNGTCESVRSAVTATFVTPPTLTVTTSNAAVCNNSVAELSVTSTISDFDSYVWSPATNLYQSDLTTPYTSGTVAYLKTTTPGSVNYTCSASNSSTSCINSAAVTVAVQPASATVSAATTSALCSSGSTTISVTPLTGFASGYLQWQSSLNGTSYADIDLATSTSISTGTISQTTYYQLLVKDGAGATCLISSTSVVVNNPLVISTTPATRCAAGTVTLGATFGGNANALNWYSASSGGAVLGTGSSFTTPSISTTTTYYVAASTASSTINAGRSTPSSTTNIAAANYGLVFNATAPFTLNTVDVYNAGAAGTMSIQLQSSTGAVLQSLTTPTIPAGTGTTATTINIGWSIPVGTGYRLMAISSPTLVREVSIIGFPYSIGTVGSITSGYQTSANTTYYYFYNWSVTTSCESARTAVVATVNAPPSITTTVDSDTLCAGQSTTLSVSSSNTDYTYTWNGGLGTSSSVNVTPSSTTSYTVTANDNSTGPNAGCYVTSSPIAVTVNPVPTSVTATASSSTACAGGSINLIGAGVSGMPQLNYTQGFESWPPTDWTFINAGSGNQWASGIVSRTGAGGMFYTYSTTAAANAWAITNGQTLFAGTTYTISFWYKVSSSSFPERLRVTVGSVATVAGQSTILWSNNGANNISNTTYAQGTMTYTPTTSGTYYFGFQCYSARDQAFLYIDDVSITSGGSLPTFAWTSSPSGFTSSVQSPSNVVVNQNTTYTLTATNGYGCTSSASQTVTVTAARPKLSISDTTLCSPNSLTISVADTGIYLSGYPSGTTVEWIGYGVTGPVGTTTISSISGSTFQAKVTVGGTGCIGLSNIITATTRSIVMNPTIKPASCGLANGKIVVTADLAYPPYRFIWKDSANTVIRDFTTNNISDSIVNLAAGNYKLDVFDNNGGTISCQSTTFNYTVGSAPAPSLNVTKTNVSCNGLSDGTATVNVTSGSSPYSYLWNAGSSNTTNSIFGLADGAYTVTVTDIYGCTSQGSVTINTPSLISVNGITTSSCSNTTNGSITLTVSGGTGTKEIKWYNSNTVLIATGVNPLTNIASGTYYALITDANNCEKTEEYYVGSINAPSTNLSAEACGSYQLPWGQTATTTGVYSHAYASYLGCDSVVNYDVAITPLTTNTSNITACETYTWSINNQTYTTSGSYSVVTGCHTELLNLTVLPIPSQPVLACYESTTFNNATCTWDITGSQPNTPTGLACYETATFNNSTCGWDVSGSQPAMPTLACYETANFNTTTCTWDVTGSQPSIPTLACYESATFNTTSCTWVVTGTQPLAPTGLACYETANFNTSSCSWVVSGSQPAMPTLACYETASFNTGSCAWDVTGTQPNMPTLACYETATFNTATCSWVVSGSQPALPALACYETASFNTGSCAWDVTGTQPSMPTLACYETASFNTTTCVWDVTGSPAAPIVTTTLVCSSYTWSANGQSYTQSGTYNYNSNCQDYTLNLTVVNVSISSLVPSSGTVGSTVVISGSGFAGATGVSFNGTSATNFTVNSNSQITATVPAGATTGAITVVVGGCSAISSANFTIGSNATLNLKAFMQGYYAGSGSMASVLANQGVSLNTNEMDTITVELREAATGTNVVASASGVIMTDGTVSLSLPTSVVGNEYYIVVNHRNTVQTWSADLVTMAATTSYDFTTAATKAFGDNMIEVETGVFAMYTGDINQDEFIDPFDYPSFELDNVTFASGYLATDLNGDGFIDPFDYPVFELNNVNFVTSVHP